MFPCDREEKGCVLKGREGKREEGRRRRRGIYVVSKRRQGHVMALGRVKER